MAKLFSKIPTYVITIHNPSTSQTDRQTDGLTDDMRSQDRALHYIVHRAVIKSQYTIKS